MSNPIKEYLGVINEIYGVFLDCTLGFQNNEKFMIENQYIASRKYNFSIQQLDEKNVNYGSGPPNVPDGILLHRCKQGQFKERNVVNGKNTIEIGNLCICQIYNYWEDYYRREIANFLQIKKNELTSDIFGDLRYYRQSVIHNRGFAIKEIEKSKVILWNKYNEQIKITKIEFEEIVIYIKIYLNSLI